MIKSVRPELRGTTLAARFSGEPAPGSDAAALQFGKLAGAQAARQPGPVAIVLDGTSGDDTLTGTADADTLNGLGGNDTLEGLGGDDVLDGGAGDDDMTGGLGNDTYYVDSAGDVIVEEAGGGTEDQVRTVVSYTLPDNVEYLIRGGGSGTLTLTGNAGNNSLSGFGGSTILDGGAGADNMVGGTIAYVDNAGDRVLNVGTVYFSIASYDALIIGDAATIRVQNQAGTGAATLLGGDLANALHGNNGDNIIDGRAGVDTMTGYLGNDSYYASSSGDVVVEAAGEGNDRVYAAVSYVLAGGADVETLSTDNNAGTGAINLTGNALANTVIGNAGANRLDGGLGNDSLEGGAGGDSFAFTTALGAGNVDAIVYFSTAADRILLLGGSGQPFAALASGTLPASAFTTGTQATTADHRIIYNSATGALLYDSDGTGAAAAVQFATLAPGLALQATHFTVEAAAGPGDDVLIGDEEANDLLEGFGGNDTLDGRGGTDTTDGGIGDDTHYVERAGDVVIERSGEGNDTVIASADYTLGAAAHVEELNAAAGTAPLYLTGNAFVNILRGNDGDNRLDGAGGADTMIGGLGNDIYYVDDAGDVIVEDALGGTADQVLAVTSYTLPDNVEILIRGGGSGLITLTGNAGNNAIAGTGNTILDGGAGADTMNGAGATAIVDNAGDRVLGVATVLFSIASYDALIIGDAATIRVQNQAGTGAVEIRGGDLANALHGNNGDNILDGRAGVDTMTGYLGNDSYYASSSGDVVVEAAGEGNDRVYAAVSYALAAGVSVETLSTDNDAGTSAIGLTGNALANTVIGNAGANRLDGGLGNDSLQGGGGADSFAFTTALGAGNVDAIADFSTAADRIVLVGGAGQPFAALSAGALPASAFTTGTQATTADHRIIYDSATGALLYDSDGTGAAAAVQFATLATGLALQATHFFVEGGAGSGDDVLIGDNEADDFLQGFGGNDTLDGRGGTDTTDGGTGDDTHYVDRAEDIVIERDGEGYDLVIASADYTLRAGVYAEELNAAAGTAPLFLTGNSLANILRGNDGDNRLDGAGGVDTMIGGNGNDVYYVDDASDAIVETAAGGTADQVLAVTSYTLPDNVEILIRGGGSGLITLTGNAGNNAIAGTGNTILDGGAGADTMNGAGATAIVDNAGDRVLGVATVLFSIASYDALIIGDAATIRVQNQAGTGAVTLLGGDMANALHGNNGDNIIDGRAGLDTMTGYLGNDSYYVSSSGDVVVEAAGEGNDRIYAAVSYTLAAGVSVETLSTTNNAGTGAINLTGNALANTIYGNAGNNTLIGLGGDDQLYGWEGTNRLEGGTGDDWYFVGYGNDTVIELAGEGDADRVFTGADFGLEGTFVEILSTDWHEGTADLALGGNALNNIIIGNDGDNILYGKGGFDTIYGNGGDDVYYVSDAGDFIVEYDNDGSDRILATVDYTLYDGGYVETISTDAIAGTSAITLGGNNLNNALIGNNGVNTLYGKGGNDTLTGHGGADTFLFTSFGAGDIDAILDFAVGTDRIAFYSSVYTGLTPGSLPASAFVNGTAAADGDDRILYNSATGALFYDADGTGATAAVQFATVTAGTSLSAADFVVF